MDYYKILGIKGNAQLGEIKSAYRKLAMQLHPDKNPNNPESNNKFQQLQEAYATLSDPEKKQRYDNTLKNSKITEFEFDFTDFYKTWGSREWANDFDNPFINNKKGNDVNINVTLTTEESYYGVSKEFNLGFDTINIDFKPGLKNGMVLKIYGRGEFNPYNSNSNRGNLIINILVNPDDRLIIQDNDIWFDLTIPFYDLILGVETQIETLFGKYKINIPPKTQPGKVLRITGKGMPIYNTNGFGSLLIKVNTSFNNLSDEQIELIKKIKEHNDKR
jgi:curved DNA-binding protein